MQSIKLKILKDPEKIHKNFQSRLIILKNPSKIYENLHYGTNLPINDDLKPYILNEIKAQNIRSVLLIDDTNSIVGHVVLYHFEGIQYFGFFNSIDARKENPIYTEKLISKILREAKKNNCDKIRGPMNLPPMIYGWGFSRENCDPTHFAISPYNENDSKFVEIFLKHGFNEWHQISHYRQPFSEYSFKNDWKISFADFKNLDSWLGEVFDIQMREFPESAQITPNRKPVAADYVKFIEQFGCKEYVQYVRDYENSGKLIGVMYATPNPFELDENGKSKTVIVNGVVVDREYQGRHIARTLLNSLKNELAKKEIYAGESIIAEDNIKSHNGVTSDGANINRSHVVLEYRF